MFNSPVIDVGLGLVFIYLMLSLLCTAARELLETWVKKRATNLAAGIRELLNDAEGTGLTRAVYEHPLIQTLFSGKYAPNKCWWEFFSKGCGTNLPSYIPARNFALALLDVIRPRRDSSPAQRRGCCTAA